MPARGLLGHGPGPGGRAPAPATHDETPTTAVTDLIAPGAPRTPPAGGRQVASDTRPDSTTPTHTQPNMPEQAPNTPKTLKTKQKPAPRIHHDAGLSTDSMVGVTLSHSNLWDECWRYVMQHASEARDVQDAADENPSSIVEASSTPASRHFNRCLRPEVVEEMARLHRTGCTVKEIAQRFGFHRETVAIHLKRTGLTLRTDVTDEAFRRRVRQAYEAVGTVEDVAEQLGVSRDTVRKVLRG